MSYQNDLEREARIASFQMIGLIVILAVCSIILEYEPIANAVIPAVLVLITIGMGLFFLGSLCWLIKLTWNGHKKLKRLQAESQKHFPLPGTRQFRQQSNRIRHLPNKTLTKRRISHASQHSLAKTLEL